MLLINFAHPLTPAQRNRAEELAGQPLDRVIEVRSQLDPSSPFDEQLDQLVRAVELSPSDWQTTPLLVNPPSLAVISCGLLARLHGLMGYFPAVLRLRPLAGPPPVQFEVAEILNLQAARDAARASR
jgi:hypothetical protein